MANPGLFKNIIGPWARRLGQRGFGNLKANAGFGWKALKANPSTFMGTGQLRAMGRVAGSMRSGNIRSLGPELGRMAGRWAMGGGVYGSPQMRGAARLFRGGAAAGGIAAGGAAADFLNPWGIGWGD